MGKAIMCQFFLISLLLKTLVAETECTEQEVVVREKCEKVCEEKFWQCSNFLEDHYGISSWCYKENTKCIDGELEAFYFIYSQMLLLHSILKLDF